MRPAPRAGTPPSHGPKTTQWNNHRGLAFYCTSRTELRLPGKVELITAKQISVPKHRLSISGGIASATVRNKKHKGVSLTIGLRVASPLGLAWRRCWPYFCRQPLPRARCPVRMDCLPCGHRGRWGGAAVPGTTVVLGTVLPSPQQSCTGQ
jgi:hypothetical protein